MRSFTQKHSKLSSAYSRPAGIIEQSSLNRKAICRDITIPLSISSYMQDLSRKSSLSHQHRQLNVPSFTIPRESYSFVSCPLAPPPLFHRSPSEKLETRLLLFPFPLENYKYFFSFTPQQHQHSSILSPSLILFLPPHSIYMYILTEISSFCSLHIFYILVKISHLLLYNIRKCCKFSFHLCSFAYFIEIYIIKYT